MCVCAVVSGPTGARVSEAALAAALRGRAAQRAMGHPRTQADEGDLHALSRGRNGGREGGREVYIIVSDREGRGDGEEDHVQ